MRIFLLTVMFSIVTVLTACETTVPPRAFPDLRYNHLPPIRLDAVRVDVIQLYKSSGTKPYVEHEFPTRPATVAAQWATDRLKAIGVSNIVRVTITKGAVVEVPLKRTTGVTGVFTTDQSERYDGTLEIKIAIIGPSGRELASVSARATRSRTVPENITLAERERTWFRMTESMMNDLNLSLERQIQQHLARWIR
jgi:hypothetical protein